MEESKNLICLCSDAVKESWGRRTSKEGLTFCRFCDGEIKGRQPTQEDEKTREAELQVSKTTENLVSGGCAVFFVGCLALFIFGASLFFGFYKP